jgi:hypothetical protein
MSGKDYMEDVMTDEEYDLLSAQAYLDRLIEVKE